MGNFVNTQNSFADGEVSEKFFARTGLNGLSKLENMDVLPSGALSRRKGLEYIINTTDNARLINFSVDEDDNYLIALSDGHLTIYNNNVMVQNLLSPWGADDIKNLQYAQRYGTMIFVHPNYRPQILKKTASSFGLSNFEFSLNPDGTRNIPFIKFDDAANINIALSTSGYGNNFATLSASASFWTSANVGDRLLLLGIQWIVYEYVSPTVIIASTNSSFTIPTSAVTDWSESAFGTKRGWPCSISFHQDRLVFGGSRSHPSGVWMSVVGNHNNFNFGTGLDDEAIFITLLSEQRQQICTVVSSDNLQILTSVGEWAISNKPLTPSAVDIKQHTYIGSIANRYLPPQKIEGKTIFIANSGFDIRELELDSISENYNANDLCALSKHLLNSPVDIAYNDQTNQLFIVLADGDIAVLNKNSALGISAWGLYKTQGDFKSITVIDGQTYVSILRGTTTYIEKFSDIIMTDGLNEYGFSFTASAMPMMTEKHNPKKIRTKKIIARVLNTKSIFINGLRGGLPNDIYDVDSAGYTGDVSINFLGTSDNTTVPIWTISGSESLPLTVLSITVYGWYLI